MAVTKIKGLVTITVIIKASVMIKVFTIIKASRGSLLVRLLLMARAITYLVWAPGMMPRQDIKQVIPYRPKETWHNLLSLLGPPTVPAQILPPETAIHLPTMA